ncbi:TPA: hypothetical protein ACTXXA_002327 [Legionella anisa]
MSYAFETVKETLIQGIAKLIRLKEAHFLLALKRNHERFSKKVDVRINEDQCPIYRGYADINLGIMRKIVLNMLNNEQTNSQGIALKRMRAAFSVQYTKKSDRFLNFEEIALFRAKLTYSI